MTPEFGGSTLHHGVDVAFLVFKILLAVFCLALLFLMLQPFLSMLVMSVVLSVSFFPVFRKLKRKFRGRETLAALVSILAIAFTIILPLGLVAYLLSREAAQFLEGVNDVAKAGGIRAYLDQLSNAPLLGRVTKIAESYNFHIDEMLTDNIQEASGFFLNQTGKLAKGFTKFIFGLIVTLFVTYYFLKDGEKAR
ncbi:MAG TPA: AI-2E family transporter, partial [Thermodesulfobacteriota bacterium]|nr:AI-2E family transporter [Thermodesulfobacteriota bacterium]